MWGGEACGRSLSVEAGPRVGRGFSQGAGWEAEDQKSKGQDLEREAGLQL